MSGADHSFVSMCMYNKFHLIGLPQLLSNLELKYSKMILILYANENKTYQNNWKTVFLPRVKLRWDWQHIFAI